MKNLDFFKTILSSSRTQRATVVPKYSRDVGVFIHLNVSVGCAVQVQALMWAGNVSEISTICVKTDVKMQKRGVLFFCSHWVLRVMEE
jgi:hypothetical protein